MPITTFLPASFLPVLCSEAQVVPYIVVSTPSLGFAQMVLGPARLPEDRELPDEPSPANVISSAPMPEQTSTLTPFLQSLALHRVTASISEDRGEMSELRPTQFDDDEDDPTSIRDMPVSLSPAEPAIGLETLIFNLARHADHETLMTPNSWNLSNGETNEVRIWVEPPAAAKPIVLQTAGNMAFAARVVSAATPEVTAPLVARTTPIRELTQAPPSALQASESASNSLLKQSEPATGRILTMPRTPERTAIPSGEASSATIRRQDTLPVVNIPVEQERHLTPPAGNSPAASRPLLKTHSIVSGASGQALRDAGEPELPKVAAPESRLAQRKIAEPGAPKLSLPELVDSGPVVIRPRSVARTASSSPVEAPAAAQEAASTSQDNQQQGSEKDGSHLPPQAPGLPWRRVVTAHGPIEQGERIEFQAATPAAVTSEQRSANTTMTLPDSSSSLPRNSPHEAAGSPALFTPAVPEVLDMKSSPHHLTLKMQSGVQDVQVHLVERGGSLHVAVRTPDSQLATELRQDLGNLVHRLENSGYRAETWTPEGGSLPELYAASSSAGTQGDGQGDEGHTPTRQDPQDQPPPRRHRPQWLDELSHGAEDPLT